jgi:cyclopropane fatty-acyl-phospholipid synthase-like methyltransferase
MSTIPENNSEYKDREYWNQRFEQEDQYDWLMPYDADLSKLLVEKGKLQTEHKILIVGCGNSTLSPGLFNDGFQNMISTDYSQVVIDKMSEKYPQMTCKNLESLVLF